MATAMQALKFNGHEIRPPVMINNEPWFVARDVCAALELTWNSKTLAGIPADWRGVRKLLTPLSNQHGSLGFQQQDVVIIREAAVYRLTFRSRKPEAAAFMDWVAGEVLPAIRKTGVYDARRRKKYEALGKSGEWIESREEGIVERKTLTSTLSEHEVTDYAGCTNAIYYPILGGNAKTVKSARQLPAKANLRDNLPADELMRVKFAEQAATTRINNDNILGDTRCRRTCQAASEAVAQAMEVFKNTPL